MIANLHTSKLYSKIADFYDLRVFFDFSLDLNCILVVVCVWIKQT